MKLGREVGLGPGHIVLDGDPAPPKGLVSWEFNVLFQHKYGYIRDKGHSPQFSAHVCCGQTVAHLRYC